MNTVSGIGCGARGAAVLVGGSLFLLSALAGADQVGVTTFENGTTADADEVNANFETLADESNAQDTRIGNVEAGKQDRVAGSCLAGSAIRVIETDGSVLCQADTNSGGDIQGVVAGAGLTGGGVVGTVTVGVASGGIGNAQLGTGAVTGDKVADGTITDQDIAAGAVGATEVDSTEVRLDWTSQPSHPACTTYTEDTDLTRETTYYDGAKQCDQLAFPEWTRFTDGGTYDRMLADRMPPKRSCDTDAPGYLVGEHPAQEDGEVTRKVCFHWGNNSCSWSADVQVVNCGDYFVYQLIDPPACSLRYCTAPIHDYSSAPTIAKFYPTNNVVGAGNWQWDVAELAIGSLDLTKGPDSITIERAGVWQICQKLMYSGVPVGGEVRTYLRVNNVIVHDSLHNGIGGFAQDAYCTMLELDVDDVVTHNNPNTVNTRYGAGGPRFSYVTFQRMR